MTTLENMIDEVLINLSGYTLQQDSATYLTAEVAATASTIASPISLSLASTEAMGKGMVEIGEEIIWIDSIERASNTAAVPPFGRAFRGTTLAAHAAGDKVTISPTFPRFVVKRAINDTIRAIGSTIYAIGSTTFTFNAAQNTYEFNDLNISNILTIMWQDVGPSEEWIPVRRWSWDGKADTTAFGANAQTVTINDYITPGRTVKVVYSTDPVELSANSDVYATTTGLPESTRDVVILGAAYRLLAFLDPARATMVSPQADETDSKRPYGASQSATKQLYALYSQRLNEETTRQQGNIRVRLHYSR